MSVTLEQALGIVRDALPDDCKPLEAYDGSTRWFFAIGTDMEVTLDSGEVAVRSVVIPGGSFVTVSKETGAIGDPHIPSVPSFVSGMPETPDEVELGAARSVWCEG